MKKIIACLYLFLAFHPVANANSAFCSHWMAVLRPVCQHLEQVWVDGRPELYVSGYAWHNRYTYTPERIQRYNEAAWGGGLGRGTFNSRGDWEGYYAIGFLDSHRHLEPAVGYAYLKVFHLSQHLRTGVGATVLVTQRSDINNGYPFPGALPWASLFYKKVALSATYIPGAAGAGNVLYLIAKYSF